MLIIHPKAEQSVSVLLPVLERRWDVTPLVTAHAGHGMTAAQQAGDQGYQWVIALGGDGTLNEVVNGVVKAEADSTVAVLPGGTVNQWNHEIGLPVHAVDAAHALLDSTPRRVDVGQIAVAALGFPTGAVDQPAMTSPTTRDHFLLTAGLGSDAAAIRATSDSFRRHFGQSTYFVNWLKTFPQNHKVPVHVQWSTTATWVGHSRQILVNNVRHYGSSVELAPRAYIDDGQLDTLIFQLPAELFDYVQDGSFSVRLPASIAMHLDGSFVPLEDFLSPENRVRLEGESDREKVLVTYRFTAKHRALSVAIPKGYAGHLFGSTMNAQ
jgi:diacylglycerol kinase family enzyme